MQTFVYVVCRGQAAADNAVEALLDASFPPDAIQIQAPLGKRVRRVPVVQRRHFGQGTVTGACLGLVAGAIAGLIISAGASRDAAVLPLLRMALGGVCVGAFIGAVAGLIHWRSRAAFPPHMPGETPIVVGVRTQPARANSAEHALRAVTHRDPSRSDGEPARVAASLLTSAI